MMMYCCISLAEWCMWDPRCLFLEICPRILYASAQLFLWATISQYRGYVWYCQDDSMVTDNMDKMQSCAIWILNSSVSATRKKILNLTTYLFALGICPYKHWTKSLVLHKCQELWDTSYWFIGISASWWTNICCKYYSYIFPILSGIQDLILIKWSSLFFTGSGCRDIDIALSLLLKRG